MSDLKKEIEKLRNTIFNMLNFTNTYVLILDEKMEIKFVNNPLAIDLGFKGYNELINHYWLEFIEEKERNLVKSVYEAVSKGYPQWEEKYREFKYNIIGKNNEKNSVYWFNSHINTNYNWSFSFGIKKQPINLDINSVRDYYQEVINKDRVMINSMRDVIRLKNKL